MVCRYPQVFRSAVCLSGTYRLQRFFDGDSYTEDLYFSSPLDFLPGLEGQQLDVLRQRFVLLASGEGAWEDIGESWAAAEVLGEQGHPEPRRQLGPEYEHEWPTWWQMYRHASISSPEALFGAAQGDAEVIAAVRRRACRRRQSRPRRPRRTLPRR